MNLFFHKIISVIVAASAVFGGLMHSSQVVPSVGAILNPSLKSLNFLSVSLSPSVSPIIAPAIIPPAPNKSKKENSSISNVPNQHSSESVQKAVARLKIALPKYKYFNLHTAGKAAVFFAFQPNNEQTPFGWYRLKLDDPNGKVLEFATSSEFNLLFRVAWSPDGRELLVTEMNGEITVQDIATGKVSAIGPFLSKYDTGVFPTYSFPSYTPDGKYLILHNRWENTLTIVDAVTKDIAKGKVVNGFWITPSGGNTPIEGSNLSVYDFSNDRTSVTFGGRHVLNLKTLTRD